MPKNSGPRFIVTPFLPKELAELLKVPIDTLIASYRQAPSPTTTANSKGKKKKKKKSGTGASEREPVIDKAAIAAAAQELLSSSIVRSYQPPISQGYNRSPPLQPLDKEVLPPRSPSIPSSKRPPTRVTVEEVPDESQATNTIPAPPPPAPETPTTPRVKPPISQPPPPPPGQPYLDYTGLPRLAPFDTYPPPSMDFLQSEAFQSFRADRLRRMYKDEINATFASDGRFNPQPGSIVYKLLEEMRGVKSRDTRDEQRRREEEKQQQEQEQAAWPTGAAEDEGGCWCSKCGCRTGQYGDEGEGIVSQP